MLANHLLLYNYKVKTSLLFMHINNNNIQYQPPSAIFTGLDVSITSHEEHCNKEMKTKND